MQGLHRAGERGQMMAEMMVVEHHAFRPGGGARSVLEQAGSIAFGRFGVEESAAVLDPRDAGQRVVGIAAEGEAGAGVVEDGFEPLTVSFAARRVGGHRDRAGIPAGEESGDKAEARGLDQQHRLARGSGVEQGGGARAGFLPECLEIHQGLRLFAIAQKAVSKAFRVVLGALVQEVGQRLGKRRRDRGRRGEGGSHAM